MSKKTTENDDEEILKSPLELQIQIFKAIEKDPGLEWLRKIAENCMKEREKNE